MPRPLRREDRKHRTARWGTSRSSLARFLSEPVDGCWLRLFPNMVRDAPKQCGLFLLAASVAPIGLISLRRYIRVPEAGRRWT